MVIDNIDALVKEHCEKPLPPFTSRDEIIRDLPEPQRFNLVQIITGMRRSGKTFYLFQKMEQLLEAGFPRERILYFNFSDDRLANRFALYGLRNSACELSVNGLVEGLREQGFKIYWEKADRLIDLLVQAFLFFEMQEFTTTLKPRSTATPKVYAVDPGIAHAVSRADQQDIGKRFETAIYLSRTATTHDRASDRDHHLLYHCGIRGS